MEHNKENWINDVLSSMEGSKRAVPSNSVFKNIENELNSETYGIINIFQSKLSIAAAFILVVLNVYVINMSLKSENQTEFDQNIEYVYQSEFLSNYVIYE